ncbi:MAG: beta-ketoacyl synthase N-terminal-like domain-containing protein [Bacteroidota bacterium]
MGVVMPVYLESDNVITSLGFTAEENLNAMEKGISGIQYCSDPELSEVVFPASLVDKERLTNEFLKSENPGFTTFEKLAFLSVRSALSGSSVDPAHPRTVFILSTTKGNIDLLHEKGKNAENSQLFLWHSAEMIRRYYHNPNQAIVISNACISGLLAMIVGQRMIKSGSYDHAVIVGADVVSKFVVSGFQSFLSLSAMPCRPFDRDRDGLTLGEGAGTVILSNRKPSGRKPAIELVAGASANDANHISGPSRTGEGLYIALKQTLIKFKKMPGFVSAHGTATPFNDDMESVALTRAGLQQVPVNSLKGFTGHTPGRGRHHRIGDWCRLSEQKSGAKNRRATASGTCKSSEYNNRKYKCAFTFICKNSFRFWRLQCCYIIYKA